MKNLYGVDDFYRIVFSFIRITFFFYFGEERGGVYFYKKIYDDNCLTSN